MRGLVIYDTVQKFIHQPRLIHHSLVHLTLELPCEAIPTRVVANKIKIRFSLPYGATYI